MIVLVLSAVPEGLRGHVRGALEISPGVFVGTLSARVRERLWDIVTENMKRVGLSWSFVRATSKDSPS